MTAETRFRQKTGSLAEGWQSELRSSLLLEWKVPLIHPVRSLVAGYDVEVIFILSDIPLSWFPRAEFTSIIKEYSSVKERFLDEPHKWAKNQMVRSDRDTR
jgi:hypothetical protein